MHRAAQSGMVRVGAGPGRSSEAALTVEAVFQAATGDRTATAVIDDAGVYLGQAAVSLVRLLNPQKLILGGAGCSLPARRWWRPSRLPWKGCPSLGPCPRRFRLRPLEAMQA